MKIIYRPFTALLAATIALAIGSSDLMAAKKDKDDKGSSRGKGKKEQVQRGGSDRGGRVAQSRPSAPRPQARVASRPKPQARPSAPKRDDSARLAMQRSHSKPQGSSKKRSDDIARHQLASASAASRSRADESKKQSIDRSAAVARARDNDKARDRARIASSRDNDRDKAKVATSRVVNRSRTDVRNQIDNRNLSAARTTRSIDRDRDGDRDRRTHSHRDRSRYTERHDHDHNHGYDWYRSNGYNYDHDYYRTYRRHRYYNDSLGVFLFSLTSPPAYVYESTPAVSYDSGYGYGFETRVAVQEELARAGYYDGSYDGVVGPGTRSAIYAYQQDYGLYATGRIDDQLLQSLGLTN